MMHSFLSSTLVQITSLTLLVALLIWLPWRMRAIEAKVKPTLLPTFRKLWHDIHVQNALAVVLPVAVALVPVILRRQPLAEAMTNAYLGICLAGGAAALWNIRKANISTRAALDASDKQLRRHRLSDIYNTNLRAYTAALACVLIGALGLLFVQVAFETMPTWLWFPAFLLTSVATYALGYSISSLFAAEIYERNPKHGAKGRRA